MGSHEIEVFVPYAPVFLRFFFVNVGLMMVH